MRLLGLGQEELQISVVCSQNEQDSYTMQDCNMSSIWGFLWRRQRHPTPVLLPGKSHGWRSLVGCSPWGHEESDTTERLHFHFSLLCIGEGNGNPLQCSCLENPRDGRAWWVAVYGVAQSRTRLKRLSSSSSSSPRTKGSHWTVFCRAVTKWDLHFKQISLALLLRRDWSGAREAPRALLRLRFQSSDLDLKWFFIITIQYNILVIYDLPQREAVS